MSLLFNFLCFAEAKLVSEGWTNFSYIDEHGTKTTGEVKKLYKVGTAKDFKKFKVKPKMEKYVEIKVPVVSKALVIPKKVVFSSNFKTDTRLRINKEYKNEIRNVITTKTSKRSGFQFTYGNDENKKEKFRKPSSMAVQQDINLKEKDANDKKIKNNLPKASKSGWDPYASLRGFYD
ncbi:MAG: hypothetical protein CME69_11825 [Halobacteriovorax sp.]|nr:hypothetical protein [Halobacteriovorax sp.]